MSSTLKLLTFKVVPGTTCAQIQRFAYVRFLMQRVEHSDKLRFSHIQTNLFEQYETFLKFQLFKSQLSSLGRVI